MNDKIIIFAGIVILVVMAVLTVFSVIPNEKNIEINSEVKKYKKITPEEAKEIMDNEKDIYVLDVRTEEEYNEGHIKNSILMPLDTIENEVQMKIHDKSAKILVYCRSGNRSKSAADILIKLGYVNVLDFGGLNTWKYELE